MSKETLHNPRDVVNPLEYCPDWDLFSVVMDQPETDRHARP